MKTPKSRARLPVLRDALLKPYRRLSLLNQFMLVSGAILLVGAVAVGWWINGRIEQVVAENAVRLAAVFVDGTIAPHLWELEDQQNISPIQKAHLDQLLHSDVNEGSYLAVHVWGRDGRSVYSSIEMPPDFANTDSPGFQSALRGEVYTRFVDHVDGMDRQDQPLDLLETYFPIRDQTGQRVLLVAEFYQSMAALRQSILFSQLQGWTFVGVATFMMFLALYGFAKRGTDTIERQTAELAESRRQIQAAAVRATDLNEAFLRRLGSDLHDGPAQDLGIALMRIEPLRQAIGVASPDGAATEPDPQAVAFDLELIHAALQSSIREIRHVAGGLRLPELRDLDVAATIRRSVADYEQKTSSKVSVKGPDLMVGDEVLKTAVYRIVQEALNNGHRHGNPAIQTVAFSVGADGLLDLRIADDGSGFDPHQVGDHAGRRPLGLAGLQERAEILGGSLVVHSRPGQGTVVHAHLPMSSINGDASGDARGE